jgi:hypothetical protein
MNERIKLLAGQSLDKVVPYTWTKLDYDEIAKLQEYFASLILQDVLSICEELGDKGLSSHYCVDKIRKEFGV